MADNTVNGSGSDRCVATSDDDSGSGCDISDEELSHEWELEQYRQAWEDMRRTFGTLRILVCGKGGTGKSALVNNLFELRPGEDKAREARPGGSTTQQVLLYERTTKFGDKIYLFDSPGFGDPVMSNKDIIVKMERVTEKKVDIILYCISLAGQTRADKEDERAFEIITQAFTMNVWKKAVIVLTCANQFQNLVRNRTDYNQTIELIRDTVKETLCKKAYITKEIVDQIPTGSAGYTEPRLQYDEEENWKDSLFVLALKRVTSQKLPSLFEVRYRWKDLANTIRMRYPKAAKGAVAGCSIGAIIGGAFVEIIGPVGPVVGGAAGSVIGGAIMARKEIRFELKRMKRIMIIKVKKWQERNKDDDDML